MKMKNVDMLSGSVFKGMLSMTIPIMVMNVMQLMFSVLDMTILGQFADDSAVGAVGACGSLLVFCTSLLIGISAGTNVVVANSIGKNDPEATGRYVGSSLLFSVIGGIILLIIGITFAETFLGWINCPEKLMNQAVLYFKIYFCSVPAMVFYSFCAAILRAAGDTRRPFIFMLLTSSLKVALNFILVKFCNMSVAGVGIATVASSTAAAILFFITLLRSKDSIRFQFRHFRFYWPEIKNMLRIGVPTGVQSSLYTLANSVIAAAVNSFGPDATTGISIANQFDGILYQVALAPSYAVIPYVAQNVGAGNFGRVKEAVSKATIITVFFGATLGFLSAIFSAELSSIMSSTPEVIMYSQQKMIIVSSTYFICGINEVLCGSLRGLNRPIVPTVSALIFLCLLRFVWVYFIFPFYPNLTFLYLVWPIGWICCIVTGLAFYIPTLGKLQKNSIASAQLN